MAMRTGEIVLCGTPFMFPTVVISSRGEERLRTGHPWIYRGDLADVRAAPGDVVLGRGPRSRPLGVALYSSRSQIAIRMLARGHLDDPPAVEAILRQRIDTAIAVREARD